MKDVLKALPKVELHRHLEGSIPIPLVIEWSKKYNLPLSLDMQVKTPMPLPQVLERLFYQQRCFQNKESVETLTYEVLKDIAQDNIKLIELRFSPGFMAEPKNLSFDTIMEATLLAKERAQQDFRIEVGFILISSRDLGVEICEETIDLALRWKKDIVGIDLAGDETNFHPELFEKPFQRAHKAGLFITTHSGEVSHPSHITTSIEKLKASRIGHGVQAIQDPKVIQYLVDHKIPLELCPTSNFITKAIPHIKEHPLKRFMELGVEVTINSDDPTLFGTTLTQEYEICMKELDFSLGDIKKTILTSLHHSFVSKEQKNRAWKNHFKSLEN
ncbi:MAG: adenosine deaminase [Deltaproteobacteria bacterium]|nr:adenosine deaminase [Deltaproteobacteria bacterium]